MSVRCVYAEYHLMIHLNPFSLMLKELMTASAHHQQTYLSLTWLQHVLHVTSSFFKLVFHLLLQARQLLHSTWTQFHSHTQTQWLVWRPLSRKPEFASGPFDHNGWKTFAWPDVIPETNHRNHPLDSVLFQPLPPHLQGGMMFFMPTLHVSTQMNIIRQIRVFSDDYVKTFHQMNDVDNGNISLQITHTLQNNWWLITTILYNVKMKTLQKQWTFRKQDNVYSQTEKLRESPLLKNRWLVLKKKTWEMEE